MKTFLKILLSALAVGVLAPALLAQDAPPADGGQRQGGQRQGGGRGQQMSPAERVAAIDKAVGGLTDEQKSKITAIIEQQQKDMQAARGSGGDRQAMMEKAQEIQKKAHDAIRALLTAEQQKKFDEMPAPGRGRGQGGGRRNGGNGGGGN